MSEATPRGSGPSPTLARNIEAVCDRFQAAWKSGQRPRIEEYLPTAAGPERFVLAPELILLDVHFRRRAGESPQPADYRDRFPHLAPAWLAGVLQEQAPCRHLGAEPTFLMSGAPLTPATEGPPLAALPSADGPLIDGYEILDVLGRGGMGVVYRARQMKLNRVVALKTVLGGARAGPEELARLLSEAEAVAQLQHPNIVQIFEVGKHGGLPYLALEFVAGGNLDSRLEGEPQQPREAAQLLETLARAVYFAHQHGIIHRDLKPANILLQSKSETRNPKSETEPQVSDFGFRVSDFEPKITDFGLAKRVEGDAGLTRSGSILGTPSYMAPEQAEGKNREIGQAADVYALGSILYEVLTGRPPFKAASAIDTLLQVIGEEPVPPRRLQSKVPRDLETICLKCLAKQPHRRYASALDLAEDLSRFQSGEPIRARPVRWPEHLGKWARRKPASAALWAVSLTAVLVFACIWRLTAWAEAEQREKTVRVVNEAIQEATRLRGRAEAAPAGDLAPWKEALSAARRAQGLLATGPVNEDLRQQVRELLAGLSSGERAASQKATAARKDQLMLARLQAVRLQGTNVTHDGVYDPAPAARGYAEAFRWYGIDADKLDLAEAARRIQARPIRAELAAALDAWGWKRRCLQGPAATWQRLFALAAAVEPDPWRRRLREALARNDRPALTRLAQAANVATLSLPTLELVADAQSAGGWGETDRAFLRRAQQQHPSNFWFNYLLGNAYHWFMQPPRLDEAIRFYTAARAVKPDCASLHQNLGIALHARGDHDEAILAYRETIRLEPHYLNAYHALGNLLEKKGDLKEAIAVFRQGLRQQANHPRLRLSLGMALEKNGSADEAIAIYRRDFRHHPEDRYLPFLLGAALEKKGLLDEAIGVFHRALRHRPKDAVLHVQLGWALWRKGLVDQAQAAYQKAVDLDKNYTDAYDRLGDTFAKKDQPEQAIAAYQKAIALKENSPDVYFKLGCTLLRKRELDRAIAALEKTVHFDRTHAEAYGWLGSAWLLKDQPARAIVDLEKAVALKENLPDAHYHLGLAWARKGQPERAQAAYRKAIHFNKDHALAHAALGVVLAKQGQLEQASVAYQKAIALNDRHPRPHYNLGLVLERQGHLDRAIASYQRAIHLDKNYAEAHAALGLALQRQGEFAPALAALQRGHDLGSKKPHWPYLTTKMIADCKRLLQLDNRLPAVAAGQDQPLDASEALTMARLCFRYRRLYATAARLFADVFKANPVLANDLKKGFRFRAACAAALAGSGQGEDTAKLSDQQKARLRGQALGWLRADLALGGKLLADGKTADRKVVKQILRQWQEDTDLAGVRQKAALARLPEAERKEWTKLWAEVATLLARAS